MSHRSVRACLILNSRSGGGNADPTEALTVLNMQKWEVVVREDHASGEATRLAREAVEEGFDPVIACGGDGTVNEVLHALVGTDVGLAVLPAGTANVWAHEIGVDPRLRVAALQMVAAERRRVDVGHISINGRHDQHFLLMAGFGMDAVVMGHTSRSLKNRIGKLAVGVAAAQSVSAIHPMHIQADLDGVQWTGTVMQIIVGNTRRYGGFTRITPDAYIDDGRLDVCMLTPEGVRGVTRQVFSLLVRQRPAGGLSETYRVQTMTIRSSTALPLQLDGGIPDGTHDGARHDDHCYVLSAIRDGVIALIPRSYDGELFRPAPLQMLQDVGGKGKKGKKKKGRKA